MLRSCKTVWCSAIECSSGKPFSQVWILQGGLQQLDQKSLQKEKQQRFHLPSCLAFSCLLSHIYHGDLGFSKHLQVFISMERFIGLLCNSDCVFSLNIWSWNAILCSKQLIYFLLENYICIVLCCRKSKFHHTDQSQIRMWCCYQGERSHVNLFLSMYSV